MASHVIICPSSVAVVGCSGRCHKRQAPGVVVPSCSSSPNSSMFRRSPSLYMTCRGLPAGSGMSVQRNGRNVMCEVAVSIGDAQSSGEQDTTAGVVQPGAKIRVKVPVPVYHVLKSPNLNLEGLEGEVKEVLFVFKGKTISANLPFKVQFIIDVKGKPVNFFAHLKDDEFEVVE